MRIIRRAAVLVVAGAMGAATLLTAAPPAHAARTDLGLIWEHANFRGNNLWLVRWEDGYVCTSNRTTSIDHHFGDLAHMQDKVTSYEAFAGCLVRLFEHHEFGGARTSFGRSVAQVSPAMNDRASSAQAS